MNARNKEEGKKHFSRRFAILVSIGILTLCIIEKITPHPRYGEVFYHLGLDAEKKHRLAKAAENYQKSIRFNPGFARAYGRLGLVYRDLGEKKKAVDFLQKAAECDRSFFEDFDTLGLFYMDSGQYDTAIECFKISVRHRNINLSRYYLGKAYLKKGYKNLCPFISLIFSVSLISTRGS